MAPAPETDRLRRRNFLYFRTPYLWPLWPLLPLVKRHEPSGQTLGVLIDVKGFFGKSDFTWHVFLDNALFIPLRFAELAVLPREEFSSPEELFASGWRVD